MPVAAEMAEACHHEFELRNQLQDEADKASIESAFEFVVDDCQRIMPPGSCLRRILSI